MNKTTGTHDVTHRIHEGKCLNCNFYSTGANPPNMTGGNTGILGDNPVCPNCLPYDRCEKHVSSTEKSMKISKKEENNIILAKIEDWQEEVGFLQNKKTELEKEILFIDIKLNDFMIKYDKLCRKLLT